MSHPRARLAYAAAAVGIIALGLAVHRGAAGWLAPAVRDVSADALWAAMLFCLVSVAWPQGRVAPRAVGTMLLCAAVESSQLVRAPWLVELRATTLGHLVLGSDFDARDLLAYAGGVLLAAAAAALGTRRAPSMASSPRAP